MASIFSDPLNTTCTFILFLETIVGISLNVLFLCVIIKESKRKMIIKTANKIRIALNTSNIFYSISLFGGAISNILGSRNAQITDSALSYAFYCLNIFTMTFSSWLTATLSSFYFLKVVDSKAAAFDWARKNINGIVPRAIVGVAVLSLFTSALSLLLFIEPQKSIINSTMSLNNSIMLKPSVIFLSVAISACSAPLLIISVNSTSIASTLRKHHHHMVKTMGASVNGKPKSFGHTPCYMMSTLLTYLLYHVFALLYYLATVAHLRIEFWVYFLPMSAFAPLLSLHQMIANPKLKGMAMEMLKRSICSQ